MKISNLVRYFTGDGTPTVRGLEYFRDMEREIASGGGGGATDLAYTAATRLLTSSTGTDVTLPLVGSDPGLMSAADKTKLDGIATGANLYVHPNHSGDVTSVADGATTIAADAVTNAKLANMAANTIKANATAGAADPADLAVGTNTVVGRVAGNIVAAQVATAQIADDAVTYAKVQNVSATSRILGRITAGAGDIEELTGTQATTLLDVFTTSLKGLAPASGGGTTNFLRADGTWAAPAGGGGGGASPLIGWFV
jgi:hypothetical protein